MTDETKKVIKELRNSDEWYKRYARKSYLAQSGIMALAANLIEKLSVDLDHVTEDDNFQRKCVGDLYAQMNQLIHQRDSWQRRAEAAERDLHSAIAADVGCALRAQMEAENKPLALDELLEMDGKPVFVTHNKYGEGWCIIDWHGVNKSWTYFSKTGTAEGMTAVPVTAETYGETWLAYRKKHLEHSEV